MRFHVVNLGCKVNRVESDGFVVSLGAKGWLLSPVTEADVIIVNTCTVTGEAEKKTRKAVRRALRSNDCAHVVVTGCAAAIDPDTYQAMDDRVVIEPDKSKVASVALELTPFMACESNELLSSAAIAGLSMPSNFASDSLTALRIGDDFPSRVGIKIQDGCSNACTFCIVHKARGKAWSREADSVIDEVVAYEKAGINEIVLTGINLGSYHFESYDLAGLLAKLLQVTDRVRFRLSSIEPRDVDERLIALLSSAEGRVCRHLHLPLQSGSSRILKEMARPYDADRFVRIVQSLYEAVPSLSLSTDIIVGFPSETNEDFEETLSLARSCRFSKIHIFPYSKRAGTPAASRKDQVDPAVKAERIERLTNLADELRSQDLNRRKGETELVLVEGRGVATSESYYQVTVPPTACRGELLQVTL